MFYTNWWKLYFVYKATHFYCHVCIGCSMIHLFNHTTWPWTNLSNQFQIFNSEWIILKGMFERWNYIYIYLKSNYSSYTPGWKSSNFLLISLLYVYKVNSISICIYKIFTCPSIAKIADFFVSSESCLSIAALKNE